MFWGRKYENIRKFETPILNNNINGNVNIKNERTCMKPDMKYPAHCESKEAMGQSTNNNDILILWEIYCKANIIKHEFVYHWERRWRKFEKEIWKF